MGDYGSHYPGFNIQSESMKTAAGKETAAVKRNR